MITHLIDVTERSILHIDLNDDGPTILQVEDNKTDALLIRKQLKVFIPNAKVESVDSIGEAYKIFRKQSVDLILLDLNLPDGFGPRSVKEIREFARKTPIVVLTGLAPDLTIKEVMRHGANEILQKTALTKDKRFKNILAKYFEVAPDTDDEEGED